MVLFLIWYKVITTVGQIIINLSDMPQTDSNNADNPLFFLGTVLILVGLFFILTLISHIKHSLFQDVPKKTGPEMFLSLIVKNVFWNSLNDKYNSENADISQSDQAIDVARGEADFILEVVRSYAFRDSDWHDRIPQVEYKITVLGPPNQDFKFGLENERDLLLQERNQHQQAIYFSEDIKNHIELMDLSSSSASNE